MLNPYDIGSGISPNTLTRAAPLSKHHNYLTVCFLIVVLIHISHDKLFLIAISDRHVLITGSNQKKRFNKRILRYLT
jgi:hypothetical protein